MTIYEVSDDFLWREHTTIPQAAFAEIDQQTDWETCNSQVADDLCQMAGTDILTACQVGDGEVEQVQGLTELP